MHISNKISSNNSKINMRLCFRVILSIPKTIYFNFKCLNFNDAMHFPILVSYDTELVELHHGIITFDCEKKPFIVKIGFDGSDGLYASKSSLCLSSGLVRFKGKASFSRGTCIRNEGVLEFGNNFWSNNNCVFWCSNRIRIGDDVLFGWNVLLRDSDGHQVIYNNLPQPIVGSINIGNHCWICSESHILKDSALFDNCILGYRSLLTKQYDMPNTLFVGQPAKPIKSDINWQRE